MSDLIERLREEARDAHEVIGSHESVMSARHIHRLGDWLLAAADELARLRQPVTSEEVREHVRVMRANGKHIDADLIERLARENARLHKLCIEWEESGNDFALLESQLEKAREDAERYRWLREVVCDFRDQKVHIYEFMAPVAYGPSVDAAIDAARAADKR